MPGPTPSLTLLVPGLFVAEEARHQSLPALQTLLARAERLAAERLPHRRAFELFGLAAGDELPVGAVCRLADCGSAAGWWMRADPVHFVADRDRLRLARGDLRIEAGEAERLTAEFNRHFAEEGLCLEAPRPSRWYLRLAQPPGDLRTSSIAEAMEGEVRPHLPRGSAALRWHARLNEIQMLFHASPVNEGRERQGRLTVNGLWLWGGGPLPDPLPPRFTRLLADDCLFSGLGRLAGVTAQPPPPALPALRPFAGSQLVLLPPHLPAGELEREWFAPLLAALKKGELGEVEIDLLTGWRFRLTPAAARRWWRRRRPLAGFLSP